MSLIASLPAGSQTWLLNSPLAPHLDAFAAHMAAGGYSAQTTRSHFLGVAHFARWMTQCALPVSLLDEQLLQQFLNVHLSHCSCPPPAVSDPCKHRSSLGHLMVVLRKCGAVADVSPAVGPIPDELHQFEEYMRNARGMIEGTLDACVGFRECCCTSLPVKSWCSPNYSLMICENSSRYSLTSWAASPMP